MFFIKQGDKFWDGKQWVEDWRQATVYGSVTAAVKRLTKNSTAKAVGLDREQWEEYCLGCESLEEEVEPLKIKPVLTKEEIKELLIAERLTLTDVIDAVIEINGIIGVGLITLSDRVSRHIRGD